MRVFLIPRPRVAGLYNAAKLVASSKAAPRLTKYLLLPLPLPLSLPLAAALRQCHLSRCTARPNMRCPLCTCPDHHNTAMLCYQTYHQAGGVVSGIKEPCDPCSTPQSQRWRAYTGCNTLPRPPFKNISSGQSFSPRTERRPELFTQRHTRRAENSSLNHSSPF
jgi:hypothetical protein